MEIVTLVKEICDEVRDHEKEISSKMDESDLNDFDTDWVKLKENQIERKMKFLETIFKFRQENKRERA